MSRDRFQRASQVFLAARQRHGEERAALIVEQCAGDAALRAEVERLLAGDAEPSSNGAMDSGVIGAALRDAAAGALHEHEISSGGGDAVRDPNIGRRIGRSRVLERIGAGGMGAVYRAEQDNPRRIVALKIIRPGLLSLSMLRRFQHEAHVLGRLQHPGIAQIFEAGTDDSGDGAQPYFVMEYVDGLSLNTYARQRALGQCERLDLLASIADAVEHAHQRGVIHRDLKPGNILVAEGIEPSRHQGTRELDASMPRSASMPRPKILDFGVARAIDSDVNVTTLHTSPGQIVGTVAYMSPEQAAGNPDDIDTRSDVYALGVIGYELLAGRPPHDLERRTVPDALRTIAETDATMLGAVDRACRGDIETIIARALEKDRARRYQSAAEFAADIRRFLRDEPILARPPSTIYQLRKFARRNKALVAGLAAVFVVLVAGIIGTSLGLSRALDEARKARRMNEYLQGMIAFLDPSKTKANQVTLRDVLDDASRRVDSELAGEPEIAAEILVTIARGYSNIAEFDLAASHGRKAIAIMTTQGVDERQIAGVWELIGLAAGRGKRPAEAGEAYRAALNINRERLGPSHYITLGNMRDLLHFLDVQDKSGEVDTLVQQVLAAAADLPENSDDQEVGLALEAVGDVLGMQHQTDLAEKYYLRAVDTLSRVKDSPYAIEQCIVTLYNLAFIHELHQRSAKAEEFSRRASELSIETYGLEHETTLIAIRPWARALRALGRLDDAERVARDSVNVRRKLYGDESVDLARDLHSLAVILSDLGRHHESIGLLTESLTLRRNLLEPGHADIGRTLMALGVAMIETGRGAEAVEPMREAIAIRIKQLGEQDASIPFMRTVLGAALLQAGALAEAESELLAALPKLGGQPAMQADALKWLVRLYEVSDKPAEAAKYRAMLAPPATQPAAAEPVG